MYTRVQGCVSSSNPRKKVEYYMCYQCIPETTSLQDNSLRRDPPFLYIDARVHLRTQRSLFNPPPCDRYLGCFRLLLSPIVLQQIALCIHLFIVLQVYLWKDSQKQIAQIKCKCISNFTRSCHMPLHRVQPFVSPPPSFEDAYFPIDVPKDFVLKLEILPI